LRQYSFIGARYWDKWASDGKDAAYTAGVLMHKMNDNTLLASSSSMRTAVALVCVYASGREEKPDLWRRARDADNLVWQKQRDQN
jgi:hypothetical protein